MAVVKRYKLNNFGDAVEDVAGTILGIDVNEEMRTSNNQAIPKALTNSSYLGIGPDGEHRYIVEPHVIAAAANKPAYEQHPEKALLGAGAIIEFTGVGSRTWFQMVQDGYPGATDKIGRTSIAFTDSVQAAVCSYTYRNGNGHGDSSRFSLGSKSAAVKMGTKE